MLLSGSLFWLFRKIFSESDGRRQRRTLVPHTHRDIKPGRSRSAVPGTQRRFEYAHPHSSIGDRERNELDGVARSITVVVACARFQHSCARLFALYATKW